MDFKVGFIGLGNMGSPMAKNILKESASLQVWDISEKQCQDFVTEGVTVARNVAEMAEQSDIIFLSLPGPKEVKEIVTGENGLVTFGKPNQYIIDLSTIDPSTSKEMALFAKNKGITYIDIPISGGVPRAAEGTLSLMVGGTEEEVEGILPYLQAMSSNIYYIGQRGGGSAIKLINNFMGSSQMFITAEAILMADHLNIPFETFYDVISTSNGSNRILTAKMPKIKNNDIEPGFTVDLTLKDLELVIQLCKDKGIANFSATLVQQWFRIAQLRGYGKKDISSIINLVREVEPVKK
ncbi:NAD(P)-dependent oxidoreductase [Psychrobacillus sp. OK032]|uniref:NAD(P)-dependent oxidoreductase n=1 Tax=Psychrobacillus sp. OK032 TaxID=1884358 RepID=UPI0008B2C7A2|nr:NAD(P)-dependent oxidoreductase [Psychrobacillus sp. OK032]SER82685.1 3-hydroxyisobutyrate dehydrogenase [Psychrobacillus sp. OK032]